MSRIPTPSPRAADRRRVGSRAGWPAALALCAVALAQPALAWDVVTSSVSGSKPATLWSFSNMFPLGDMFAVGAKLRMAPDASVLIGPTTGPAVGFVDAELRAQAALDLSAFLPLGNLHPVLTPYAGIRGLVFPEGPLLPAPNLTGINHLIGLIYGGQVTVSLPMQLKLSGYVGATTFVSGGWAKAGGDGNWTSGSIDTAGTTVPVLGFNLNWALTDWLSLYAGYETTQLPTEVRGQPDHLSAERAQIGTLHAGITFPFLTL